MPYEPFHERFPEVAAQETRSFIIFNAPDLPDGEYTLIEAYCNEPNCDCRRVFFNVYHQQKRKIVAVIAYGWESREFYVKWFGRDDPPIIEELQGPALNSLSRQSEIAPAVLEMVRAILQDKHYVARLKRHYKMFKATVDGARRRSARWVPTGRARKKHKQRDAQKW